MEPELLTQLARRCAQCPLILRVAEACPWRSEFLLLHPVKLLTESDFLRRFNEDFEGWSQSLPNDNPELKAAYQQGDDLYRPMILGMPRVDEVIYYTAFLMSWLLEILVSLSAAMIFLIVPIYAALFIVNRKPVFLRIIISLVTLKSMTVVFHMLQIYQLDEQAFTCDLYGNPKLNPGLSDAGLQISSLITSYLMQTITLNNQSLNDSDTALLKLQVVTGFFAYVVY